MAIPRRDESDICPATSNGDEVSGYQIFCGAVVDPADANDTILPADTQVATFADCLSLCDKKTTCTGLSYIEASTTCYLHSGSSKSPVQRNGWDGAIKVAQAKSENSSPTTSTAASTTPTSATSIVTSISSGSTISESSSVSTSSSSTQLSTSSVSTKSSNIVTKTLVSTASTNTSSSAPEISNHTLSAGAKAGIAIGTIGLAAMIFVAFVYCFRVKRNGCQKSAKLPALPLHAPSSKQEPGIVSRMAAFLPGKERRSKRPMSKLRSQLLAQKKDEMNNFAEIKIDCAELEAPATHRSELP